MLQNYLRVAIRNLMRQKFHTAINVIGLALGMMCVILIAMYIRWELSFNTQFSNTDNLYRIVRSTVSSGDARTYDIRTSGALADVLRETYPEVADVTRLIRQDVFVGNGDEMISQMICFADDNVFKTFPLTFVKGDSESWITSRGSLAISETLAQKLFGDVDPIGKTIRVEGMRLGEACLVSGVFRVPPNSTLHCDLLTTASSAMFPHDQWVSWRPRGWRRVETFVRLREGVQVLDFEHKIQNILKQYMGDDVLEKNAYHMQPFDRIYLHSRQDYNIAKPRGGGHTFEYGNVDHLYLAGLISGFLFLIACINFVNLSTSRATLRAKEIGVRKVVGANKNNLVLQFLTESVLIALVALVLAFSFSDVVFSAFNQMLQTQIQADAVLDVSFVVVAFVVAVFTGVCAGLYPAFVLSAFQPVFVLKNNGVSTGSATFRRGLVVFQFAATIVFIALTSVISDQLRFLNQKDLGFRKEGIIGLPVFDVARLTTYWGRSAVDLKRQQERVRNRFLQHPNVLDASVARFPVSNGGRSAFRFEGVTQHDRQLKYTGIDNRYLGLFDIALLEGRNFPVHFMGQLEQGAEMEFIVSRSLVNEMGWENPIGQIVEWPYYKKRGPVVGVVDDVHFGPLHDKTEPVIFVPEMWNLKVLYVQVRLENLPETIAFLEEAWSSFLPDRPFQYEFVDAQVAQWYKSEKRQEKMVAVFSGLAILIASFGLLGLVSFSVARRTKEIGIRKVLGASVHALLALLTREYLVLILIANMVAWPIGFYVAQTWLTSFAYRIDLEMSTFVLAGVVALAIALLTVCIHTFKAARANPVDALRNE